MAENKKICEFANKWNGKFRSEDTLEREVEFDLGSECVALGFQMDCGKSFQKLYGDAFYDPAKMDRIADEITDEMLLGSAIYSKWRFCTHWTQTSILSEENRQWFRCAFYRLSILTQESWKKGWVRQAKKESSPLQEVMLKTLEQYLRLHPEE